MTAVTANITSVSGTLMNISNVKEPTIFRVAIKRFSGPWWATSEMSNRSVTSFDIISPVLLRS